MNSLISTYEKDRRTVDPEHMVIRDRLVSDLIRNRTEQSESIRKRFAEKGMNPYFSYPTLALFDIAGEFQDQWTKRESAEQLRSFIEHRITCNCIVFMDDACHIGILFSWDDLDKVRSIHSCLKGPNLHTATAGIGNPCKHLAELHTSYLQATSSLTHKFYRGIGQIILYNSIAPFKNTIDYPEAQEESLFHLLSDSAEMPLISSAIDCFYQSFLVHGPSQPNDIRDATIRLLIGLQHRVKSSATTRTLTIMKPDIMSILHLQSIDEIKAYVTCYMQLLVNEIHALSTESINRTLIRKALTIMEDEYDRVTLHYVAEKVFITPAYLSTLFKTNMGITFIEHLTEIRIRKAKRLLKQAELKNYEVAEKVGYHDSRYFSQIFKKKVGLSPSDYRNSLQTTGS